MVKTENDESLRDDTVTPSWEKFNIIIDMEKGILITNQCPNGEKEW